MSFEEIIKNTSEISYKDVGKFKTFYTDFICDNSDQISYMNILGGFLKTIDFRTDIEETGFDRKSKVKTKIIDYCSNYNLTVKTFTEMLNFTVQLLNIMRFALTEEKYSQMIQNLSNYQKPNLKDQKLIIDVIMRNNFNNIARRVDVKNEKGETLRRLETFIYPDAKFFKTSFVQKNGLFYVYQYIVEIDG